MYGLDRKLLFFSLGIFFIYPSFKTLNCDQEFNNISCGMQKRTTSITWGPREREKPWQATYANSKPIH